MKVIEDLALFEKPDFSVVTIGTFDGVHVGHQVILNQLTKVARDHNGKSILITFWPHPRFVLKGADPSLKLLSTFEEKVHLLSALNLDYLIKIPFTPEFSNLSADDFVKKILVDPIGTKRLFIGYDHHFGRNREGDIHFLQKSAEKHDFQVEEIPRQDIDDIGVSSTKIRNHLSEGEVQLANVLLGTAYSIEGKVVHGDKLGRTIGYPTANIEIRDDYKLLPADGAYAVRMILKRKKLDGMCNIGFKPTVKGNKRTIEAHLFQFNSDIYGEDISLEFIQVLRKEMKFDSVAELKAQLDKDKQHAIKLLS